MINTLIGKKIDQTQKFLEDGKRVPVTLISVADNAVLQVKTQEKDAYTAVQIGFGTKKNPTKPASGHAKKAGFEKVSVVVKEVRVADEEVPAAGESIAIDSVFALGDIVSVTGTSKGKGFAGVVKRHNFRGGPKTHGQSDRERAPGSIGQTTTPGRVYKGKRMAGRMGSDQVTLPNLTVVGVDVEKKVLLVTGLIPGHRGAIVTITKTGARKKALELIEEKVKREAREAIEAASNAAAAAEAAKEAEIAAKIAEEEAAKAAAAAPKEEVVEETKVEAEAPVEETKEEKVEEKAEEVAVNEEVKETEASEAKVESTSAEATADKEETAEEVKDASASSAQEEEKK